jgi:RNA polymerase sigma factor (sigma-70 family)
MAYSRFRALMAAAQAGDTAARNALWMQYARTVTHAVQRFAFRPQDLADAMQEGQLGLVRAIEKYDISLGYELTTYAHWWMCQRMDRYRRSKLLMVHMPDYAYNEHRAFEVRRGKRSDRRAWFDCQQAVMDEKHNPEVAIHMELTFRLNHPVSVRRAVRVADPSPHVTALLHQREQNAMIGLALDTSLPSRSAEIIRRRFGLDGMPEQTLEEVGQVLGITRERVRQIEAKAMSRLKKTLARVEHEGNVLAMAVSRETLEPVPERSPYAPRPRWRLVGANTMAEFVVHVNNIRRVSGCPLIDRVIEPSL